MNPRDQLMLDLFTTALEGGIGYWSHCSHYNWGKLDVDGVTLNEDYENFYALVMEDDGDETPEHRIDRSVIVRGYRLATSMEWADKISWSTEAPPEVVNDDTDWDFDAGDADVIVQLGLFGDVRYG